MFLREASARLSLGGELSILYQKSRLSAKKVQECTWIYSWANLVNRGPIGAYWVTKGQPGRTLPSQTVCLSSSFRTCSYKVESPLLVGMFPVSPFFPTLSLTLLSLFYERTKEVKNNLWHIGSSGFVEVLSNYGCYIFISLSSLGYY